MPYHSLKKLRAESLRLKISRVKIAISARRLKATPRREIRFFVGRSTIQRHFEWAVLPDSAANNNVAAHIFDYLVLRDERQKPIPGLAESWKTIDPLTWEFKLRKGVKFHDGSDFTAADVVASIERVPQVPNSPSAFTAYTKQIKEMLVIDPYTIRFKTATPYPLMPSDLTQVAIISKLAAKASTEDFASRKLIAK